MRTSFWVLLIISVAMSGCTEKKTNKMEKVGETLQAAPAKRSVHGDAPKAGSNDIGMVAVVKKQQLPDFATLPIGAAIDKYRFFTKKEWKESRNTTGTFYVDVTGWLDSSTLDVKSIKEGIALRGVQIKFAIYENGAFGVAMVSKMEAKTDGKVYAYPLGNPKAVLASIYANKEISF